jgi:Ca2+-binding EF-hand superfamily protein
LVAGKEHGIYGEEVLKAAFEFFDQDGDGYISTTELWHAMASFVFVMVFCGSSFTGITRSVVEGPTDVDIGQIMLLEADMNSDDGQVNYEEFAR